MARRSSLVRSSGDAIGGVNFGGSVITAYENESGMPIGTVVAACDEIRVAAAIE